MLIQRGVACLTEGCPGKVSYCAVQKGPLKDPQEVHVLVQPEDKTAALPEGKNRHVKSKKKASDKAHAHGHKGLSHLNPPSHRHRYSTVTGFLEFCFWPLVQLSPSFPGGVPLEVH